MKQNYELISHKYYIKNYKLKGKLNIIKHYVNDRLNEYNNCKDKTINNINHVLYYKVLMDIWELLTGEYDEK